MKKLHKKAASMQAFNLILAIPIIIISIVFFYMFASDKLSIGQQSQTEADMALVKLDMQLSELQIPENIDAKGMDTILKNFFKKNNYKLFLPPSDMPQEICKDGITCSFLVISPYTKHKKTYYREIIIPTQSMIKTITLKGEILE